MAAGKNRNRMGDATPEKEFLQRAGRSLREGCITPFQWRFS
jgi:hypothetical protein